jgi:hypothetical protein
MTQLPFPRAHARLFIFYFLFLFLWFLYIFKATHYTQPAAREFICVDANAQAHALSSPGDENGLKSPRHLIFSGRRLFFFFFFGWMVFNGHLVPQKRTFLPFHNTPPLRLPGALLYPTETEIDGVIANSFTGYKYERQTNPKINLEFLDLNGVPALNAAT